MGIFIFHIALLAAGLSCVFCKQPHILLIIADDYGWNDVGFHGSEIETPTLDVLAAEGVKLNNYYVQPICTPTRSQLLSGRYQIHTGLQHHVIYPPVPNALPKEIPTLADKLREVGYCTHIVGKWHLGFYKSEYLPTNRGFDTFFGYLEGAEDYFNHTRCYGTYCGLDFYNNLQPVLDKNGSYSAHVFVEQVNNLVEQHVTTKSDQPLFMYVPFQSVHSPLEVPEKYIQKYMHIKNTQRRTYAGMVSALDEAVKNVTQSFKDHGLWEDTILVFSTDNGGQVHAGGNNYPLKGWKGSLWEGGVRAVGFVHSQQIEQKGRTTQQLMHVTDWFPTLLNLAGGNTSGLQLDGHDVWSTISVTEATKSAKVIQELDVEDIINLMTDNSFSDTASPRKELLHNIDPLQNPRGKRLHPTLFDTRVRSAIRQGDWKLLTGDPGVDKEQHVKPPKEEFPTTTLFFNPECKESVNDISPLADCVAKPVFDKQIIIEDGIFKLREDKDKNVWLYNMKSDPYEYRDLSDKYPDVVMKLLERLTYYNSTAVPCRYPPPDPNADPSKHGGLWGPWED